MRFAVVLVALSAVHLQAQPRSRTRLAPPNAPAMIVTRGDEVELRYRDVAIFTARLSSTGAMPRLRTLVDSSAGKLTQIVSWTAGDDRITLRGTIHGTADAFAVDADPREDGVPIVRHSVGPSYNLLNRGVYARSDDWLLSLDFPSTAEVTPVAGGDSSAFAVEAVGGEVTLRFRPRYFQKHRGLAYYEPWKYSPWPRSAAGWTSWFAYRDRITEADVRSAVDVIAERLAPFGYEYVQIDDGFQRLPIGVPANWLETNEKFPAGLKGMHDDITTHGLQAGLWTNTSFADSAWAMAHPRYFVRTPAGTPARGNWIGYVMDGANPATMRDLVLPVYRQLKAQGWSYFKVDALRHLRYEGYNSHAEFYRRRGLDRVRVYRSFVQQIRDVIGRDAFLLASWGPRPELVGIIDATRLGDDGFGYGSFSQFNSFNNVVWRNDPDHIEIARADGYRSATITSLTGSLLMLTDRPEVYRSGRVEAARRTAPVLFTLPGQAYDLDPSRSDRLFMVDHEVSGSGPRPFEADQRLQETLYQLDIARPFERWTVLARTAGAPDSLRVGDLGLAPGREYVAFDFWGKRFLGAFRDTLVAGPIDTAFQVQVLCIRERRPHPQLLATNRHVSCGGVDLEQVSWNGESLSGVSRVVAGDDYELYVTEPDGWTAAAVDAAGSSAVLREQHDQMRRISMRGTGSGSIAWTVRYRRSR
ncbi:MAG: alpha-galactosidase [Gemmatimonadaceae bacterium]